MSIRREKNQIEKIIVYKMSWNRLFLLYCYMKKVSFCLNRDLNRNESEGNYHDNKQMKIEKEETQQS